MASREISKHFTGEAEPEIILEKMPNNGADLEPELPSITTIYPLTAEVDHNQSDDDLITFSSTVSSPTCLIEQNPHTANTIDKNVPLDCSWTNTSKDAVEFVQNTNFEGGVFPQSPLSSIAGRLPDAGEETADESFEGLSPFTSPRRANSELYSVREPVDFETIEDSSVSKC